MEGKKKRRRKKVTSRSTEELVLKNHSTILIDFAYDFTHEN